MTPLVASDGAAPPARIVSLSDVFHEPTRVPCPLLLSPLFEATSSSCIRRNGAPFFFLYGTGGSLPHTRFFPVDEVRSRDICVSGSFGI